LRSCSSSTPRAARAGGLTTSTAFRAAIPTVLHEHPDVIEAAIIGVPHDELGEEVGAAVVLKPDHHAEADDIKRFVKQRVAAYKYPRHVWFEEALPKGPTGKILRREIKPPSSLVTR